MSRSYGGRDPFDDPFFSRPFGSSVFGSTVPKDLQGTSKSCGVVIEELDSDDELVLIDDMDNNENTEKSDTHRMNASTGTQPLQPVIEHPEDQSDDYNKRAGKSKSIDMSYTSDRNKVTESKTHGVSFQRVTYGGINGAYYTSSTTRKSGGERVVWEEVKQADTTTGEATHRISRGVHDKGHSVTRKLNPDGKVDTMQALHNMEEDELARFEQNWEGNADKHLPVWDHGFANFGKSSRGLATWSDDLVQPFSAHFGRDAAWRNHRDNEAHFSQGRPKKVVTIPIE